MLDRCGHAAMHAACATDTRHTTTHTHTTHDKRHHATLPLTALRARPAGRTVPGATTPQQTPNAARVCSRRACYSDNPHPCTLGQRE
jgi:hypothetical protein